jgi:hypothetical protein
MRTTINHASKLRIHSEAESYFENEVASSQKVVVADKNEERRGRG